MGDTTHTAGPFYVFRYGVAFEIRAVKRHSACASSSRAIATIERDEDIVHVGGSARANAHLFKASPALLDVARKVVRAFEAIEKETGGDLTEVPDELIEAADAARAAIAAAVVFCPFDATTADECATFRERAAAGLAIPGAEVCAFHDAPCSCGHERDDHCFEGGRTEPGRCHLCKCLDYVAAPAVLS